MTVLRYTVPPENEGCKLGLFLRMQGVTAGLIKSVKYDGDGFYALTLERTEAAAGEHE